MFESGRLITVKKNQSTLIHDARKESGENFFFFLLRLCGFQNYVHHGVIVNQTQTLLTYILLTIHDKGNITMERDLDRQFALIISLAK